MELKEIPFCLDGTQDSTVDEGTPFISGRTLFHLTERGLGPTRVDRFRETHMKPQ